jgi:hypothetical protein
MQKIPSKYYKKSRRIGRDNTILQTIVYNDKHEHFAIFYTTASGGHSALLLFVGGKIGTYRSILTEEYI